MFKIYDNEKKNFIFETESYDIAFSSMQEFIDEDKAKGKDSSDDRYSIWNREDNNFNKLYHTNVNSHTEQKWNGQKYLTYLSWAWAWAEFKKVHPEAKYEIKMFEDEKGLKRPYIYDQILGYMVMTSITAGNQTYEMWLPVMDGSNKSMKAEPYTYNVKVKDKNGERFVEKTVSQATMWEVNRCIMRCLVKNMAMFGLGLYIYSGEDLPENESETEQVKNEKKVNPKKDEKPQERTTVSDAEKEVYEKYKEAISILESMKDKSMAKSKYDQEGIGIDLKAVGCGLEKTGMTAELNYMTSLFQKKIFKDK